MFIAVRAKVNSRNVKFTLTGDTCVDQLNIRSYIKGHGAIWYNLPAYTDIISKSYSRIL